MPAQHDIERRISDVEKRMSSMEEWCDGRDVELAVIRGPVPLEHEKPVGYGALGSVVATHTAARRLLLRVLSGVAVLIAGGSTGAYMALRGHLVQVGRDIEIQSMKDEHMRNLERRVLCLEGDYLACDHPPVVVPKTP